MSDGVGLDGLLAEIAAVVGRRSGSPTPPAGWSPRVWAPRRTCRPPPTSSSPAGSGAGCAARRPASRGALRCCVRSAYWPSSSDARTRPSARAPSPGGCSRGPHRAGAGGRGGGRSCGGAGGPVAGGFAGAGSARRRGVVGRPRRGGGARRRRGAAGVRGGRGGRHPGCRARRGAGSLGAARSGAALGSRLLAAVDRPLSRRGVGSVRGVVVGRLPPTWSRSGTGSPRCARPWPWSTRSGCRARPASSR